MSHFAKSYPSLANVKDYGATGDGTTDDTAAIQAAFDDLAVTELGGVFFPAGTYRINFNGIDGIGGRDSNIEVRGVGTSSILKWLDGDQLGGNTPMLTFFNGDAFLRIYDLVFDGNVANITNPGASSSLLSAQTVSDVIIENCVFRDAGGNGLASVGAGCERHVIENCFFDNINNSAAYFDCNELIIEGCIFTNPVDTGSYAIRVENSPNTLISSCDVQYAAGAVHGRALYADSFTELVVANCVFNGGVDIDSITDVFFAGCSISSALGQPLLLRNTINTILSGCLVECTHASSICAEVRNPGANISLVGNVFYSDGTSEVVQIDVGTTRDLEDFLFVGNIVEGIATTNSGLAFFLQSNSVTTGLLINHNTFVGPFSIAPINFDNVGAGPTVNGPVSIVGNTFRDPAGGVTDAIVFDAGGAPPASYSFIPLIADNHCEYDAIVAAASFALFDEPCYIAGGGGGPIAGSVGLQNAGTQFVGTGSPNGNITGYPGDTFLRLDGSEGATFYIKSSGAGTNTGWTAGDIYSPPEKWNQDNIAASQSGVALSALVSTNFGSIKAVRDGSIVGLSTRFTETLTDATADSAVVWATINGVKTTLSLSHSSGTNPDGGEVTQEAGIDTFSAGDTLGIVITTLASFTPTTTDIEAWLEIVD